jgi:hypothetical protein
MTSRSLDGPALELIAIGGGVIFGAYLYKPVAQYVEGYFSPDSTAVLGALVGLQGSLLGFVLAALTIVLGYQDRPQLNVVRASGRLKDLFRIYFAGIRAHGLATVVALLAIVMNTQGPLHAATVGLVALTSLLAIIRLARTLWVTKQVVEAVSIDLSKAPGQP